MSDILTTQQRDIALACHIMVANKLDSGPFGNISIRDPNRDAFWINPTGLIFNQITPNDILLIDMNGKVLEGRSEPHPGEFIHREIYRYRSDLCAIVHTHSDNTVMQSLLNSVIEPYTQLGASLYGDQGLYSGFTGPVRTSDEGAAIAEALKSYSIVIAKNHGLFATAASIQAAVWDMVIADIAAKIHVNARQMGLPPAELLSKEYMQKSRLEVRDRQCEFMWHAFVAGLQRQHLSETIIDSSNISRREALR